MNRYLPYAIILLLISVGFSLAQAPKATSAVPVYGYRIIHTYPHDATAFTQGLEYREGVLFEGTGLNGRSALRRVDLETGRVLQQIPLEQKYFGEGITVFNRQIVELTWTSQVGFVYDQGTFRLIRTFDYSGEGWGMANDGQQIYMSDGTPDIRVWDPQTFAEKRRITVRDGSTPIRMLNELEFVRGEIYANVWQTNRIARISPSDGKVTGWIDLTGILSPAERSEPGAVLNGIAFDPLGDRLFVTGKLWPKLFEIQISEKKP